ncbi:MAG: ATP synthase F1 subunit epsilon [Armatimonadetes bacterium]|nr:ATP synthase F1 subunit epsilon [Armatimonadota bacterium]
MDKIHLEVIQPTQTKINEDVDHIIIPGVEGDIGVSLDHTPLITKIRSGILFLYNGSNIEKYAIHDGFATIENNTVIIVCEVIEKFSEIDETRASAAKERAENRLKSSAENIDFRRAEFAMRKALARLDIVKK